MKIPDGSRAVKMYIVADLGDMTFACLSCSVYLQYIVLYNVSTPPTLRLDYICMLFGLKVVLDDNQMRNDLFRV